MKASTSSKVRAAMEAQWAKRGAENALRLAMWTTTNTTIRCWNCQIKRKSLKGG